MKTGGHFDDVIKMIDDMISVLRDEAQEDIAHRDRCEDKQNANKNAKDDFNHEITKAKEEIEQLEQAIKDKEAEIKSIEEDMKKTKATMEEMTELRNKETEEFKKKVKESEEAIKLLDEAKRAISDFHAGKLLQLSAKPSTTKNNAVQLVHAEPKPETNWDAEGGNYKGYGQGATGIVAILDLIQEDLQQEIKAASQDEIDAQVDYEKDMSSLTATLRASEKAKVKAEVEKGELETKKADTTQYKEDQEKNLEDEEAMSDAIAKDCDWVKTHFEKRATARKEEMDALVEAKDFLAGVGTDSDLSLP
jgi:DNA repair exonuclease SbcCD ATPase subunit